MSDLKGKKGAFWELMDTAKAATGIGMAPTPAHPPVSPEKQKLYDEEIKKLEHRKAAREIGIMPSPKDLIENEPYDFAHTTDYRTPSELGIGPSADWSKRADARMASLAEGIGAPTTPAPKKKQAPAYMTPSSSQIAALRRTDPEAADQAVAKVANADAEIWRAFAKFRAAERKAGRWDGTGPIDLRKGGESEPSS